MSAESDAPTKAIDVNQPLSTLGKYQIERKLGQGGMGTVYLARNTDLKKLVALKVLPRDKAKNPILVRRFKAEAQAAGQLEHPNIVSVYDTGEADGFLYIAMEYVEGIDLFEQVRRRGVIPVKRSIEIIKQVASALQHAFEHNIVHRDIKPSNLLLRHDGVVKVTDLGLARSIDDTLETNITRAGTTVGTVDYMAPEQARSSKSADVRSDIYSLGCTWYQMLTGEPPYAEGSLTNKLQAHAIKPLPDPREKNENIPEGLIAVLQRMTAKKPADRYQTPAELLEDLANSKLTKAAFSNEIFSDLSDYDVDALQSVEEELDDSEDDDPAEEERPKRRKSRAADEDGYDETPTAKNRRKNRSRIEQDDDSEEAPDAAPRRKNRNVTPDTNLDEETQPIRSRLKPSSKSRIDDDDEDDDQPRSSPKRITSATDDEETDGPSKSKRKRSSNAPEEDSAPRVKSAKGSTSADGRESNAAKYAPKPLPPKREPVDSTNDNRIKFSLEPLKFIGIAAGVLAAVAGLGWLIVQWSGQVETTNNPFANKTVPSQEPVVITPPTIKPPENKDKEGDAAVSVTVVEPAKQATSATDRVVTSEYDITKQALPAWASSVSADPADLPVFTAGPGVPSATHFSSLDEALLATDRAGGIVRLIGNGPFVLSRVEISNAKKIVVTGATPQDQPLIIVRSGESGSSLGIAVNNGTLELRGLHFALDRSTSNDSTLTKIISVTDGQLFVRKCSFTANGNDVTDAIAIEFTSKQDSQNVPVIEPHLLLDHVTVRGNGLIGLQINRTMADVVVQDSLIVTGTAPAISVTGKLLGGLADLVDSKPRRTIRVFRSTLCGRKQVFELSAENSLKPPTTAVLLQDSICTAEGAGNTAVIVSAIHWPIVTSTTAGWLTNLNWSSKASLYIGFERLLDLVKSSYEVRTLEQWQRVWHNSEPAQFQRFTWPESVIAEISSVQPQEFDTSKLPFQEMKTSKGHLPGCMTSQLTVPGIISQPRITALGLRPKLPTAILKPADSRPTRKVNLQKEDLGVIINKNDWQNDTVFEATGAGVHAMQPVRIIGKSLRIIFRQADGPPLKILPKVQDAKSRTENAGLFTIEKGTLELQSALLEAPQTPKGGAATPWLIYARNANVILRGCQLSGPTLQDLDQHLGLIDWSTTNNTPIAGYEPNFLSVNDSMLMSTGVGIRFQSATGRLFVRNSIVAVRGYGIDLQPIRTGTNLLPVVDLEHITFSTTKAAFRVEAATGTDPITTPMRIFADSCAVVAPLEFKPGETSESTIIECAGPVLEQAQIEWWGTSNGFSKEVKSFVVQSGKEPVTTAAGWASTWGEPNDVRLLTGSKGVLLSKALPNKWTLLKPYSFLLDLHSPSASWAEGGRPIGADIRSVEESIVAKKASIDKQPANGQTTKPSGAPTVGGKKNVGF